MNEENRDIESEQTGGNIANQIISPEETAVPQTGEQPLIALHDLNDNMEVHHHAHHEQCKKNWKSYFWEFLMLFLAVFCGFLAEYQLEHKIEKDRAKQYVISFYQDLKTDTAEFSRLIAIDKTKLSVLSGARHCYDTLLSNPTSSSCLKQIIRHSLSFINLVNTERTLQQLKNAGGMRMLKKEDADSIYGYDNRLRSYLGYEISLLQERQTNLRNFYTELLNFPDMTALRFPADSAGGNSREQLLFSADKKQLNKLFNQVSEYTQGIRARLTFLTGLNAAADRMLQYFKSKYNLE
jgi:hypothetical protein